MEVITLSKIDLIIEAIKGGTKVSTQQKRLAELVGRAKAYTTPIATKNNNKEQISNYITNQIELINKLSVDEADRASALDSAWKDYMKVQAMPDNKFGGTQSGHGLSPEWSNTDNLTSKPVTNDTSSTRGGLLDGNDTESVQPFHPEDTD